MAVSDLPRGSLPIAAAALALAAAAVIAPGLAGPPQPHRTTLTSVSVPAQPTKPRPPRLPANFLGKGRYIVPDLHVNVPFSWQGRNGDSQMIAGGPQYRIWFTNLIYRGSLYTLTYKWPRIPLDPRRRCDRVGAFSRQKFNNLLKTARFAGTEILLGATKQRVDHWRIGVVAGSTLPGKEPRIPLALGDIYVDQRDPSRWRQVLQFGIQNLFDPQLDEWFTMATFSHRPGQVTLPAQCPQPLAR